MKTSLDQQPIILTSLLNQPIETGFEYLLERVRELIISHSESRRTELEDLLSRQELSVTQAQQISQSLQTLVNSREIKLTINTADQMLVCSRYLKSEAVELRAFLRSQAEKQRAVAIKHFVRLVTYSDFDGKTSNRDFSEINFLRSLDIVSQQPDIQFTAVWPSVAEYMDSKNCTPSDFSRIADFLENFRATSVSDLPTYCFEVLDHMHQALREHILSASVVLRNLAAGNQELGDCGNLELTKARTLWRSLKTNLDHVAGESDEYAAQRLAVRGTGILLDTLNATQGVLDGAHFQQRERAIRAVAVTFIHSLFPLVSWYNDLVDVMEKELWKSLQRGDRNPAVNVCYFDDALVQTLETLTGLNRAAWCVLDRYQSMFVTEQTAWSDRRDAAQRRHPDLNLAIYDELSNIGKELDGHPGEHINRLEQQLISEGVEPNTLSMLKGIAETRERQVRFHTQFRALVFLMKNEWFCYNGNENLRFFDKHS